jgi:peptide-methionine (R)-S-oxide reductase
MSDSNHVGPALLFLFFVISPFLFWIVSVSAEPPIQRPFPPSTVDKNGDRGVRLDEAQWRMWLNDKEFHVLRKDGTERSFSGKYWNQKGDGVYRCAGCGTKLFASSKKFRSGTGWPSFTEPITFSLVKRVVDRTLLGSQRTEVRCDVCDGHLGHVFDDGPAPTGKRYCINSAALHFEPEPKESLERP